MSNDNLETLFKELGFKTPVSEVTPEAQDIIVDFLKAEKQYRQQHKIKRLLRASGLKQVKTFEQFDWNFNPKIPKADIMSFRNSPWIEGAFNLVLIGDTGLGKSHIAEALCYEAILKGFPTIRVTAYDLVSKVNSALNPSTKINYYAKMRVLCIDELGYVYHNKDSTDIIFQIVSKRNEVLPTIVTTNLPPKQWGSIFSGAAASAILDRLSYNGRFITLEGRSYRLLKRHKSK